MTAQRLRQFSDELDNLVAACVRAKGQAETLRESIALVATLRRDVHLGAAPEATVDAVRAVQAHLEPATQAVAALYATLARVDALARERAGLKEPAGLARVVPFVPEEEYSARGL